MAPFFCAAENMRDACLSPRERAPSGWLSSPLWFIPCFWLWTCIFDCDPQGGSGGSLLSPRRLHKIRVCPEGFGRSFFSLAAMPWSACADRSLDSVSGWVAGPFSLEGFCPLGAMRPQYTSLYHAPSTCHLTKAGVLWEDEPWVWGPSDFQSIAMWWSGFLLAFLPQWTPLAWGKPVCIWLELTNDLSGEMAFRRQPT